MNYTQILNNIAQALFDKKAANILALDVRSFYPLADFCLIAQGNVNRHLAALAEAAVFAAKELGVETHRVYGSGTDDWVVVDFGNLILHLMTEEMRERYNLEELLSEGKVISLSLKVERSR